MQQKSENSRLTAAEVGTLWAQYINATMTLCMFKYFLVKSEDEEIGQVLDFAQQIAQSKIQRIKGALESDNYSVPIGFTDSDVNVQAPRLYSDRFALAYVRDIARFALATYGVSLNTAARRDVRTHFTACINESVEMDERAVQAEKSKGLQMRAPYISTPAGPEFVQSSDFLGSIFGDKRPLSAIEITNLIVGSGNGMLSSALFMSFAQTAESKEVREFFLRGKQIMHKQGEVLNAALDNNDMPGPVNLGSEVTNSTVAPFSDKLMLQHASLMAKAGLIYYGTALGFTARTDLTASYVRLMTEIVQYMEDAIVLLIRHKWMEQPPLAEDRRALVMR